MLTFVVHLEETGGGRTRGAADIGWSDEAQMFTR